MNHRPPPPPPPSLARYDSAPGSFFSSLRQDDTMAHFFSGDSTSDSTAPHSPEHLRPYGLPDVHVAAAPATRNVGGTHLVRHSSSPAGWLSNFLVDIPGISSFGNYSQTESNPIHSLQNGRLRSQLSFSGHHSLSQISEIGENISWDESTSIAFSDPLNKRAKINNDDIVTSLSNVESQFNLPSSLEYLEMQNESVPCKVRAKRGCATHPRSIAERERRTRISKRLEKLQDLIPNMDKQTSTSEMLDLAIDHINELKNQLQRLEQAQKHCTCGSKQ